MKRFESSNKCLLTTKYETNHTILNPRLDELLHSMQIPSSEEARDRGFMSRIMRCTFDSVDTARPSCPVSSRLVNYTKLMVLFIECAAEISTRCHLVECPLGATTMAENSVILSLEANVS